MTTEHEELPGPTLFGTQRPLHLLLVEDTIESVRLVERALHESRLWPHVRLARAPTLADALGRLQEGDFDCVLLDLGLPDARGVGTVRSLLERFPGTTVVVLSGNDDEHAALEALNVGAQECLVKGEVGGEALVRLLVHAVERNRLLKALHALRSREYFLATHDALTQLPNRQLFRDRAEIAVARARRSGERVAVCYLDLDGFKPINDVLGHAMGDRVLEEVARALRAQTRETDTVARMGGDEFVVLLESSESTVDIEGVARRLVDGVDAIAAVGGHAVHLSASLGVAVFPDHGDDVDTLLAHADMAMFFSKSRESGGCRFFDPAMHGDWQQRSRFAAALSEALAAGRLVPYFQPWWHAASRSVAGIEVLARWQSSDGRLLPPDEFLPAAEASGQILDLGRTMLDTVADGWRTWARTLMPPVLEFNLSRRELRDPRHLADWYRRAEGLLPPSASLQVQAPARVLSAQRDAGISRGLAYLQANGVRICHGRLPLVDAHQALETEPVDALRIGRPSVLDADGTFPAGNRDLLQALLQRAAEREVAVIVSGVENDVQAAALYEAGCELMQGYVLSEPADSGRTRELLTGAP